MNPSASAITIGLLLVAGGCLAAAPPRNAAKLLGPDLSRNALPIGCDENRTAVAHALDGGPVEATALAIHPCLFEIGWPGWEPTIGLTSDGTVFYYPAMARSTATASEIGVARSRDEGATWQRLVPSIGPLATHPTSADPYLYVDPKTDRIFAEDLVVPPYNCGIMSISDDGGFSWRHSLSGCLQWDHVTIFAGPPVSSRTLGYPNIVYRCAMTLVATGFASLASSCQSSIDGGFTWLPPGTPPYVTNPQGSQLLGIPGHCDGALAHGVVDDRGWVYLPKGYCGYPYLAISKDEGLTWERHRVSQLGMNYGLYPFVVPLEIVGHETAVAVDPRGNLFYLWPAEDRLLYLAISVDGGRAWSPPLSVGAPGLTQAVLPAAFAIGEGAIAFAYLGSTNAPKAPFPRCRIPEDPACVTRPPDPDGSNVTWNGYIAFLYDGLSAAPRVLTATVNDPLDPLVRGGCSPFSCPGVGDFIDLRIGPDGTPWASFVDACRGECVNASAQGSDVMPIVGRLWGESLLNESPAS